MRSELNVKASKARPLTHTIQQDRMLLCVQMCALGQGKNMEAGDRSKTESTKEACALSCLRSQNRMEEK